jgi:hypothetical protein
MSHSQSPSSLTTSSSESVNSVRKVIRPVHQLPCDTFITYTRALALYHYEPLAQLFTMIQPAVRATSPRTSSCPDFLEQILSISRYFQSRDLVYPSPTAISNGKSHLVVLPQIKIDDVIAYSRGPIAAILPDSESICFIFHISSESTSSLCVHLRYIITFFMLVSTCELKSIRKPEKSPSQRNITRYVIDTLFDLFATFLPFPLGHFTYTNVPKSSLFQLSLPAYVHEHKFPHFASLFLCLETLLESFPFRHFMRLIYEPTQTEIVNWTTYRNSNRCINVEIFNCETEILIVIPSKDEIDHLFPYGSFSSFFTNLISLPSELQLLCYDYTMSHLLNRCDFHFDSDSEAFRHNDTRPIIVPTNWKPSTVFGDDIHRTLSFTVILSRSTLGRNNIQRQSRPTFCDSPCIGSVNHIPSYQQMNSIREIRPLTKSADTLTAVHGLMAPTTCHFPSTTQCPSARKHKYFDCLTTNPFLTDIYE